MEREDDDYAAIWDMTLMSMTWYMLVSLGFSIANLRRRRPDGQGASLSGAYRRPIRHRAWAGRGRPIKRWSRGRGLVDEPNDIARQASSATDIPSTSSSRPSTSQRPGYMPEMFAHYDPWSSFPQVPVSDLHMGDGHEDLDLEIIFDEYFLRPTARPTAPSASPAPRAAQEPSHMSSQEPVDTYVHSSAPVDPSPLVQIDPSPPPATAPGSAQETVEEPAKEPSNQPSREAVDTHVYVFTMK
ncbi:uncharacterized protein LOC132063052 [Lycium ferocissimum]|uniref:uncharacterized protein LOC132063052 n=1 Tax=Lycium ferocissimum TaxID=112874 RepID=UPI002815FF0E|nr:uncharacterized protein LOC132063052 [Lycium ferocissimum]